MGKQSPIMDIDLMIDLIKILEGKNHEWKAAAVLFAWKIIFSNINEAKREDWRDKGVVI